VQKVSNVILNMNVYIRDAHTGKLVISMSADFRGNTDESSSRRELSAVQPAACARLRSAPLMLQQRRGCSPDPETPQANIHKRIQGADGNDGMLQRARGCPRRKIPL
jgi:hypothetical protein